MLLKLLAPKRVAPCHYNTWPPIAQNALAWAEIRPVLAVLQSPAFVARVAALKGYEAAGTGQVLSLADAFPV